jgi:hypothetical protein
MRFAAFRLPSADRERWFIAARLLGISQSALAREALREHVARVLASAVTRTVETR